MVLSTNSCAISEHKRYMDDGGGGGGGNHTATQHWSPHQTQCKEQVRPVNPLIIIAVGSEKSAFLWCSPDLTASSGCLLSLENIRFLPSTSFSVLCILLRHFSQQLYFSVVVCYTSESLIVALSFRHLMGGDSKVLLLQSPFFCGEFKCRPPASKSKACHADSISSP